MSKASPSSKKTCTIERVPNIIRGANESVYTPKLFSIDPYHNPNRKKPSPNLTKMEHIKLHYMNTLLLRNKERSDLASEIEKDMMEIEELVRTCCSEMEEMKSEEFVTMMMLDGCFIIQLFLNMEYEDAKEDDPILRTKWMLPIVSVDLLMLENQLPFIVLKRIYSLVNGPSTRIRSLEDLAFDFFKYLIPMNNDMPKVPHVVDHLLYLCLLHIIPIRPTPPPTFDSQDIRYQRRTVFPSAKMTSSSFIPSASEIKYRGITFGRKENTTILDVEIRGKVLKISTLSLYGASLYIFQNSAALEQCFQKYGTHCTSYANLMKHLIHSPKDVVRLKRYKIFEHSSGNNEELALFFDKICMCVSPHLKQIYIYHIFIKK